MPEHTTRDALLTKVRSKRAEIAAYLSKAEPRTSGLIMCSIVGGSLAAALTAGPGIGGEGFISSAQNVVSLGMPVWQILCLLATLSSVAAVIANGLLKANNLTSKIADARSCDTKLEGIETMIELEQINIQQATRDYTQCLAQVPYIGAR